ncbi:MAG TPA: PDZ domain-containing protein [Terriglobales bacterium]|jgi:membrane-associated protease RseP (regulator of RpoE activity)|nr:PDZ domain-containing protein [Terriglobales bacterium]
MRNSILRVLIVPVLLAVAYGAQWYSQEPFDENFGYSGEDFGGGSYLGVDTRDITADRLSDLKLKEEQGVEVTLVDQDAPAGKAGLKEHDVILSINGSQVESVEQLRRMIHEIPPGRVVTIGISRDGQSMNLKAQLADRKKNFAMATPGKFAFAMPALPAIPAIPAMPALPDMDVPVSIVVVHSSARSGLMVENLTPQLGDFFGAKNGQGVLVRSVEKGSRAEKAGFRAGDVIVKVNGESINDSGDFTHAIHGRKNSTVNVSIIRDRKEQTLTLSLPERNQSEMMDESIEAPEIDAETEIDLSQVQSEMARVEPEITQAVRRIRPALEEAQREIRQHQQELKQEMRELQQELRDQERELEENSRQRVWQLPQADI